MQGALIDVCILIYRCTRQCGAFKKMRELALMLGVSDTICQERLFRSQKSITCGRELGNADRGNLCR